MWFKCQLAFWRTGSISTQVPFDRPMFDLGQWQDFYFLLSIYLDVSSLSSTGRAFARVAAGSGNM